MKVRIIPFLIVSSLPFEVRWWVIYYGSLTISYVIPMYNIVNRITERNYITMLQLHIGPHLAQSSFMQSKPVLGESPATKIPWIRLSRKLCRSTENQMCSYARLLTYDDPPRNQKFHFWNYIGRTADGTSNTAIYAEHLGTILHSHQLADIYIISHGYTQVYSSIQV